MLELRTLGTIDLRRDDGTRIESVLMNSKRLALLAYVCTSHPPRLHRRDSLVALFWPELDEVHARGALRQELVRLRRALGEGVILCERNEAIGVDDQRLWCDAAALDASLQAKDLNQALGFWGGEFLPGLHVNGGEFERWLDDKRESLRLRTVGAARSLIEDAEQAGDLAGAVGAARRLTELAPYDETGWQRLISLLDAEGDRAGALSAYDALSTRLRAELEVEPSPETQALIERIRTRVEAFAGTPSRNTPPGLLADAQQTNGGGSMPDSGTGSMANRAGRQRLRRQRWAAVNQIAHWYSPSGHLDVPVLMINTRRDQQTPVRHVLTFAELVAAAGSGDLLLQRIPDRFGHCAFPESEEVAAMEDLANWVRTGVRPIS